MGQSLSREHLEDRYFVQKVQLGKGACAVVNRAKDKQTGEVVAIKQINKFFTLTHEFCRASVEREIHAMQACQHPNILRFYGCFEDSRHIFLALEYCDGGDFGDTVKEKSQSLKEGEAMVWMKQVCRAIQALHLKQICHRDIKPDNFMVSSKGAGLGLGILKLCDFGLATLTVDEKPLIEKCGTPGYMAPEVHQLPENCQGYSFGVDVWAAGILMFSLLNQGRHPFVDSHGELMMHRLFAGQLDFSPGWFAFFTPFSEHRRSSHLAEGLCRGMVETIPASRITARAALENPWFRQKPRKGDSSHALDDFRSRFGCGPYADVQNGGEVCGREFAPTEYIDTDHAKSHRHGNGLYDETESLIVLL